MRPCAAARGRCVAYRSAACDGCPDLCVVILGCCAAPSFVARGAPLSLVSPRPCGLCPLLPASFAAFFFESTLVSHCRLSAEAPRSLTLNDVSPSCRSSGGSPRTQVPRVYPHVAVPALRPGTRVAYSDRQSAGSRAVFDVGGLWSYLSPWLLPTVGIVPRRSVTSKKTLGMVASGTVPVCTAHSTIPQS